MKKTETVNQDSHSIVPQFNLNTVAEYLYDLDN